MSCFFKKINLLFFYCLIFLFSESYSQLSFDTGAVPLPAEEYERINYDESLNALGFNSYLASSYSLENYVPPVRRQKGSSCSGFAVIYYALSTQFNQKFNITDEIDKTGHSFDPYFAYNLISYVDDTLEDVQRCDQGNYVEDVLEILKDKGAKKRFFPPFLTCFDPIDKNDNSFLDYTLPYSISNYNRIPYNRMISGVKTSIYNNKPVVIAMHLNDSFGYIDSSGITKSADFEGPYYHAMTVIAYDDYFNGGSFKVVNSWGENWGNSGYFWISYDNFNKHVRELYTIDLKMPQKDFIFNDYARLDIDQLRTYEGQLYNNYFDGYGIYSYQVDEQTYNLIGKWNRNNKEMDGHYVFVEEDYITSLVYDNGVLQESRPVAFGFSGSKTNKEQSMFLAAFDYYYNSSEKPVRRRSKGVKIRKLNY